MCILCWMSVFLVMLKYLRLSSVSGKFLMCSVFGTLSLVISEYPCFELSMFKKFFCGLFP